MTIPECEVLPRYGDHWPKHKHRARSRRHRRARNRNRRRPQEATE